MNERKAGFSLVEVCLAVLVVGLGLLSVFGLFPFGLRASEASVADTRAALFAEHVFAGIRANSGAIASWDEWVKADLCGGPRVALEVYSTGLNVDPDSIPFPPGQQEEYVRYCLEIPYDESTHTRTARLQVWEGRVGAKDSPQSEFYTELFFSGM